jgi:hypothetical protein
MILVEHDHMIQTAFKSLLDYLPNNHMAIIILPNGKELRVTI